MLELSPMISSPLGMSHHIRRMWNSTNIHIKSISIWFLGGGFHWRLLSVTEVFGLTRQEACFLKDHMSCVWLRKKGLGNMIQSWQLTTESMKYSWKHGIFEIEKFTTCFMLPTKTLLLSILLFLIFSDSVSAVVVLRVAFVFHSSPFSPRAPTSSICEVVRPSGLISNLYIFSGKKKKS